jgi:hypothetical protein
MWMNIPRPELETTSIDWAQMSRFLPEDGRRFQSPKRVLKNKHGAVFLDKDRTMEKVQKYNIYTTVK